MSKVERKEYQETKVMRTVSPGGRNLRSSNQNLAEFDQNLDYLLDDLQNSVSRPGSSLGTYNRQDTSKTNSLNRFAKTSTPVEYSSDDAYNYTSPDGNKKVTGYKKESYSYKSSGGAPPPAGENKVRMQNSINQLDSLLDDLQQVKKTSHVESESYNNTGTDPDFGTTSSKRSVQRELHYGDSPASRSNSRNRTLEREYQYSSSNEGTYGDLRQMRPISPAPSSRTSTLSKQTKVSNVHKYPVEVMETTTPDINPEILAHLDPSLHPPGNTKVTTTIKTYEYEIPGSGSYPTNFDSTINTTVDASKYNSRTYSPVLNQSQSTPSKSFVYKKFEDEIEENTINFQPPPPPSADTTWQNKVYKETSNVETNYNNFNNPPPYQKPPPPVGGHTVVKETITTRNYQPEIIPSANQTYYYNESTTTRNYDPIPPPSRHQETYIKEVHDRNITNTRDYPPPIKQHTYIKEVEKTNTLNNGYNHPPPVKLQQQPPNNEPLNIQYRYKSESTTTNNYKTGYPPDDSSRILLPKPFPRDDNHPDGPPKRLDDLMANIGGEPPNSPYNAGFNAHEHELEQKKKIDSLKRPKDDVEQQKEVVQRSKNVSGPPVYYPPGHEMFAKKEEAAWRAQGGYEKASGKYEYEAESNSKSKKSSGAAIVPVCLPLCCGLPCALI